jgi:hypothetical protein
MPNYTNEFQRPDHYEHEILCDGKKLGTLRVKPVSILWKPAGKRKFFAVSLEDFTKWITGQGSGAKQVAN